MSTTKRLTTVLAAAAALAVSATVVTAPSAQAATVFTVHLLPSNSFGLLVDVNGASKTNGANIIQWYANGGANQLWTFAPINGTNTYFIINVNSNECLTTDGVAGDDVYQEPCLNALTQGWTTDLTGNPYDIPRGIKSAWTGLYLDVYNASQLAGAHLDTWYFNGGTNQSFSVSP